MVRHLSFDEGSGRMLTFLDSFCLGRTGEFFCCLDGMKKEESVLPVITALYNRLRPALYLGLFPGKGGEWVRLVLQIKDYPMKMSREALRRYPGKALADLSMGLLVLSWKEKTGLAEGGRGLPLWQMHGGDGGKIKSRRTGVPQTQRFSPLGKGGLIGWP